jgi:hypothetical protein
MQIPRLWKVFGGMVAVVVSGVAAAVLALLYADYSEDHWTPRLIWLQLAVFTVLTFGLLVSEFRPSWNRASFWVALLALLGAHVALYAVVLAHVSEWRLVWFMIVGIAEGSLLIRVFAGAGFPVACGITDDGARTLGCPPAPPPPVPEPATLWLAGGAAAMLARRRRSEWLAHPPTRHLVMTAGSS